jgi:hypothetical protein
VAENPAFDITDCRLLRLARRTLAEADLEHSEEANQRIEGVVPLREAPPQPVL